MAQMPFGRFKGHDLEDLPRPYVVWLLTLDDLPEPLASAIHAEAERRGIVPSSAPSPLRRLAEEVIGAGVRSLARRAHPDVGGSHDEMVQINEAAHWLRQQLRGALR